MFAVTRYRIVLLIVVSLILLASGQLFAQEHTPGCTVEIPQWVRDRQQYETTFVWMPPATELVDAAGMSEIPQWVIDRQQYEVTYVYTPPASLPQTVSVARVIPQWAIDRQQYEATYVYVPPASDFSLVYDACGVEDS